MTKQVAEECALELPGLQGGLQEGIRPFGVLGRTPASLTEQGYAFGSRYWRREDVQEDGEGSREDPQEGGGGSREDTQAGGEGSREDTRENEKGSRENWDTIRASTAVYMTDTLPPELKSISDEIEELVYKDFWNMVYAEDEAEFEEIWQALTASARKAGMDSLSGFYEEAWSRALERAAEPEGRLQ